MAYSTRHHNDKHQFEPIFRTAPFANLNEESCGLAYYYSKRLLDLFLVCLSFPFLLPLFIVVAIWIKLDSDGPVLYRQARVGTRPLIRHGKVEWRPEKFNIFKFRSMSINTDDTIHQEHVRAWINGELADDDSRPVAKVKDDPRITRVGHVLRKTSIDELPQLINILRGEMSLVGPRPVPEYEAALYRPQDYVRLNALPGLTGLWQVVGRGNVSFTEMMELDIEYVRTRTLWKDITIIVRTIPAVLLGKGAE